MWVFMAQTKFLLLILMIWQTVELFWTITMYCQFVHPHAVLLWLDDIQYILVSQAWKHINCGKQRKRRLFKTPLTGCLQLRHVPLSAEIILNKNQTMFYIYLFWFLRYATSRDFCCFTIWSWSWWSISTSVSERARLPNTCYWQGNKNNDCADGCVYWPACKYKLRSLFQFPLSTTLSCRCGDTVCKSVSFQPCHQGSWKWGWFCVCLQSVLLALPAFLPSLMSISLFLPPLL